MYDVRWREENIKTDLASPRGVCGIYSVYFLHAEHISPRRCQYAAHNMSHSASVFPGKHPSHSSVSVPPKRSNVSSVNTVVLTPEKIVYTSDVELDWAAPSWLSTGVKL